MKLTKNRKQRKSSKNQKGNITLVIGLFVGLLLLASAGALIVSNKQTTPPEKIPQPSPTNDDANSLQMRTFVPCNPDNTPSPKGGRPFLFGTNIGSQFVTSASTRELFQKMHIRFLRVGFLSQDDVSTITPNESTMLHFVRDMCITPLFILHIVTHGQDPTPVDTTIVKNAYQIFGDRPIYFEFDNEPNLHSHTPQDYVTQWNKVIPQIKNIDPNAKFGGPTLSQALPAYLSYFVHNANPKPDFISWHEYNCQPKDNPQECMGRLSDWKRNVTDVTNAIEQQDDTVPPIIISEWNYAIFDGPDPRATPDFLRTYVHNAFLNLVENKIFAATEFKSTDFHQTPQYMLINPDNTLTPEGEAFETMYNQLMGN